MASVSTVLSFTPSFFQTTSAGAGAPRSLPRSALPVGWLAGSNGPEHEVEAGALTL